MSRIWTKKQTMRPNIGPLLFTLLSLQQGWDPKEHQQNSFSAFLSASPTLCLTPVRSDKVISLSFFLLIMPAQVFIYVVPGITFWASAGTMLENSVSFSLMFC